MYTRLKTAHPGLDKKIYMQVDSLKNTKRDSLAKSCFYNIVDSIEQDMIRAPDVGYDCLLFVMFPLAVSPGL